MHIWPNSNTVLIFDACEDQFQKKAINLNHQTYIIIIKKKKHIVLTIFPISISSWVRIFYNFYFHAP